ncbi:TPA: class I SAM-dependent methyltransferase [Pseudomonas aeruginosa]|nr:class I SAM-dependent methyltransferase [Pseudomonas aeruginosa]
MWDERYAAEEYVYGTEPNAFLKEHAQRLAGPVLSVAEGEGRNAVFLASLGLEVLGVDGSTVGLAKARRLAEAKGVSIDTLEAELPECEVLLAREIEREVVEGRFHTGAACVVQFIARKR